MDDLGREQSTVDARAIRPLTMHALGVGGDAGVVALAVEGEFDLAAVPAVRERLDATIAEGARGVVLDLEQVGFVDSSALRELLRADAALRAAGAALVLVGVQPAVARLLELTRTTGMLTLAPTVEQALTQLAERS
jgi:anti-sigma B factor antagonist